MLLLLERLLQSLALIVPLLIAIAYATLAERKVMGAIQRRRGPNVVGWIGLLQPLADGLKLLVKETILPTSANPSLFYFAPILAFGVSLLGWAVIPFAHGGVFTDLNLGILYLFAVTGFAVYSLILAGWASNSIYPFLGALRSAAQMVSYEVSIGFLFLSVILCAGSVNLSALVLAQQDIWYVFPLFPAFLMMVISGLAETNRHPFDLPEAEAELVAGFQTELSSLGFAMFQLAEFGEVLFFAALGTLLFLGGWLPPLAIVPLTWLPGGFWFGLKMCAFVAFFIWVRASFPRYRYDQLMRLGWKVILPLSLGWLAFTASVLVSFNWLA